MLGHFRLELTRVFSHANIYMQAYMYKRINQLKVEIHQMSGIEFVTAQAMSKPAKTIRTISPAR